MGVDHRRADIGMAQQFLNSADIVPLLQEMGGKGVAECVATCLFGYTKVADSRFDNSLD